MFLIYRSIGCSFSCFAGIEKATSPNKKKTLPLCTSPARELIELDGFIGSMAS
jgi:hypothetical protein